MRLVFLLGLGALLSACQADVFSGGDGGTADATSDAITSSDAILGGGDGTTVPADVIKCASNTTCTAPSQECCTVTEWAAATCQSSISANVTNCARFLACDDTTDCPTAGDKCCADVLMGDAGFQTVLGTHCVAVSCAPTQVQLCASSSECPANAGNCNDWNGTPGWVWTCQP